MVYDLQVVCPLTNDGKAWFFCSKKKKRLGCGFCTYEAQILHVRQRIGIEDVSDIDTPRYFPNTYRICDLVYLFFFFQISDVCPPRYVKGTR